MDVQHIVNLLEPFNGNLAEPVPQAPGLLVTMFELSKPFPASVSVFRMFFGFSVDADVVLQ